MYSDDLYEKPRRHGSQTPLHHKIQAMLNTRLSRALLAVAAVFVVSFFLFTNGSSDVARFPSAGSQSQQGKTASAGSQSAADSLGCTKSWDGIRPVTQYVIMIDAGSSGSRVHVYTFNNCQETPRLLGEEFKMIEPGLSSYKDDVDAAAHSLDVLMDVAMNTIPEDSRSCSPVAVKATAGLRILGPERANAILDAVRAHLENDYPFPVVGGDGVSIMDGSDEGVYAWVTTNYLLGNIGGSEKGRTAAVMDMGGGSTQIVFEPTFKVPTQQMPDGDHKYQLDFGDNKFSLYQHSHLMYGLNEARKRILGEIVSNYLKDGKTISPSGGSTLVNPCLPPGTNATGVKVEARDGTTSVTDQGPATQEYIVDFVGPKHGSALQCRNLAESILNKDGDCAMPPCSFNGVHQPSLVDSFLPDSDIYVFSFFYDRTSPLGMPNSFSVDELKALTSQVCAGPEAYDSFGAIPGAVEALQKNPHWCLELNYMLGLLRTGYDIPGHREVRIAKKIKGNEMGWCLGASLPLLDMKNGGWTCKITQQG